MPDSWGSSYASASGYVARSLGNSPDLGAGSNAVGLLARGKESHRGWLSGSRRTLLMDVAEVVLAVAQLVATVGAVSVGVYATHTATSSARAEREAVDKRWGEERVDAQAKDEQLHARWIQDRDDSRRGWLADREAEHSRWLRDRQVATYVRFDDALLHLQSAQRRRLRRVPTRVHREFQSAISTLELLGSGTVRKRTYRVWELSEAWSASRSTEAWDQLLDAIDELRHVIRVELGIVPSSSSQVTDTEIS